MYIFYLFILFIFLYTKNIKNNFGQWTFCGCFLNLLSDRLSKPAKGSASDIKCAARVWISLLLLAKKLFSSFCTA